MGSSNPRLSVPRDPPVWCEAETGSAVNITPELPAEQEETLSKHGRRRAVINPHPRMVGRSGRLGAATRVVPQRFVFRLCLLVRQRRFFHIGNAACELMQPSVRWQETIRAPRQAREYPCRAGPARARVSGQRLVMQRPCESKVLQLNARFAWQKGFHGRHSRRGKDSKTLVLAAFFGYFLTLLAESTPSEIKQGVPCEGMRIATGAVRPCNDSF